MSQDVALLYSSLKPESIRIEVPLTGDDTAAEYLRTYHEWRVIYGPKDSCINELRLAILVESERDSPSVKQRDRLEWLARMIRCEQDSVVSGQMQ